MEGLKEFLYTKVEPYSKERSSFELDFGDGSGDSFFTCGYKTGRGGGHLLSDGDPDGTGSGSGDSSWLTGHCPFSFYLHPDEHRPFGLSNYNNQPVHYINNIPTVITEIKGSSAKAFIINKDLTTTDCFVVKLDSSFAHGKTLSKAIKSAEESFMIKFLVFSGDRYKNI